MRLIQQFAGHIIQWRLGPSLQQLFLLGIERRQHRKGLPVLQRRVVRDRRQLQRCFRAARVRQDDERRKGNTQERALNEASHYISPEDE
jgi:hypothetical protein